MWPVFVAGTTEFEGFFIIWKKTQGRGRTDFDEDEVDSGFFPETQADDGEQSLEDSWGLKSF